MKGYDEWRLSTPWDDACPHCQGWKEHDCPECDGDDPECPECGGNGTVECECQEEPDADYLYERERDRRAGL